jgi:hypothetical protein
MIYLRSRVVNIEEQSSINFMNCAGQEVAMLEKASTSASR